MGVTVYKPDGYTQDKIDAAKKEAKDHPAKISVDRLSAKVELVVKESFTTKPDGAKFTFGGWELSVTNKSVKLYSELITYDNATTGAVYRQDKNYLSDEQPDVSNASTMETGRRRAEGIRARSGGSRGRRPFAQSPSAWGTPPASAAGCSQ